MKKIIISSILLIFMIVCTSCNMQVIDTTYSFDYAYIRLANGEVVEGPIDSWKDYEDGDQLQVVIKGTTYLTHASNVTLIKY